MRTAKRLAILAAAIGLGVGLPPSSSTHSNSAIAAPVNAGANAALNRRMPEVRFENIGLGDAIDFIRDVAGANVTVNWRTLAEANVTKETPINVRLYNVSLRKVLTTVLTEAGAGTALSYLVDDGVIEITTQALADARLYIRIYNIEDLLMEIPDFDNAPDFDLTQQQGNNSSGGGSGGGSRGGGGGGGGSGGGSGGLFGGGGNNRQPEKVKTKDERAQEILTLIQETIRPEIWKDNGGPASIRYYNGNLIVSAPLSVHEMIGG